MKNFLIGEIINTSLTVFFLCFKMPLIEVGRICEKLTGREQGKKCVILEIIDKNFVMITGPKSLTGIKRRRVNVNHVKPLPSKVKIERDAPDEVVLEVLKKGESAEEETEGTTIQEVT